MRSFTALTMFCAAALGATAPARAETLQVIGLTPANNDRAATLKSIVVGEFGGPEGPTLAIRVEDVLRQVSIGTTPYFRVLPAATATGGGDGMLRGTAEAVVQLSRYTEDRQQCTAKDAGGKCTRTEKVKVNCARRTVRLDIAMRLVVADGTLIYSDDRPESIQDSYCDDDAKAPRARADLVRDMVVRIGGRVRDDFAPGLRSDVIRVEESRKGLSKPDAARVGQALKLTRTDPREACAVWKALARDNAAHAPTQFNAGLCAEAAGADQEARAAYGAVLRIDPASAPARRAMLRLDSRARAQAQVDAHNRA